MQTDINGKKTPATTFEFNVKFMGCSYECRVARLASKTQYSRDHTFIHEVVTPWGEVLRAPFSPYYRAMRPLFVAWIECFLPPTAPFDLVEFDEPFLESLLDASRVSGIALGDWRYLADVRNALEYTYPQVEEVERQRFAGHSLWSVRRAHRTKVSGPEDPDIWYPEAGDWFHEVALPDETILIPPFSVCSLPNQPTFRRWVSLGCPPAAPFGRKSLDRRFLSRLVRVEGEFSVARGNWDLLATMERLSRTPQEAASRP